MNVACNSLVARNPLARRVWQAKRFEPSHIPGLGLDLDASYGVLNSIGPDVPATNGQNVRRWLDKSGNGRNFEQSIALYQPVFNSSGYVVFDGVDDGLFALNQNLLRNVPGVTVSIVFRQNQTAAPDPAYLLTASGFASANRLICAVDKPTFSYFVGGRRLDGGTNVTVRTANGTENLNAKFMTFWQNYGAADLAAYIDGAMAASGSAGVAGNTSDTLSDYIGLANAQALNRGISANVSRVLVWPRALTASELLRVHRYLSATYGIALA